MAKATSKLEPILERVFEAELRFDNPETQAQQWANKHLDEYEAAPFKSKRAAFRKWKVAISRVIYGQTPVREIPIQDLRIMRSLSASDAIEQKYADKINSPLTAIRAFCVQCQGDVAGVRNCAAIDCPCYPFRMGMNPFYGRIADADVEATEELENTIERGLDDADPA